ncbi:MAG TPA: phosphatase PAP2 family protein [Clostridia bacterium]|nr:phosphatase PAP2 family protein [Clostridia bacterium]
MELLRFFEAHRTPVFDSIMSLLTLLGEENALIALGLVILWCVNKKWGFRLFFMGLLGSGLNQLLKAIFLIPRPWVLDPEFTIVESSREAASGYSFPSGHTQSAFMLFGTLSLWLKKRFIYIGGAVLILLVGVSRLYLGVHTPLDVGVSLLTGLVLLLLAAPLYKKADSSQNTEFIILCAGALFCVITLLYVLFAPVTALNVSEFDADGVKSMFTIVGAMLALVLSWWADTRYLNFSVEAKWWVQALKAILGLGLILGLRILLKAPLIALFGTDGLENGVRYFIITAAGGILWPMSFPYFKRLGEAQKKK